MRVALIEDEPNKSDRLVKVLLSMLNGASWVIESFTNVRDAAIAARSAAYDLYILDVALPTFAKAGMEGAAGKAQQSGGGMEVVRTLHRYSKRARIVIVTQYIDIPLNAGPVPLMRAGREIEKSYDVRVFDVIQYSEIDSGWEARFKSAVERAVEDISA